MAGPIRRFYDFYRPPPHYPARPFESGIGDQSPLVQASANNSDNKEGEPGGGQEMPVRGAMRAHVISVTVAAILIMLVAVWMLV